MKEYRIEVTIWDKKTNQTFIAEREISFSNEFNVISYAATVIEMMRSYYKGNQDIKKAIVYEVDNPLNILLNVKNKEMR